MTVSLIGVCVAIIVTAGIVIVSHRISRRVPDIDLRDGWLIEHHSRGHITLTCTLCPFSIEVENMAGDQMMADFVAELTEQHQRQQRHTGRTS